MATKFRQSQDLLQEYIDGGSYFLAAKVAVDAGVQDGDKLSPLQFAYSTDIFQVPIHIGTLRSKEAQDLIIYSVSSYSQGRVGIQSYPEFTIEDECMWDYKEKPLENIIQINLIALTMGKHTLDRNMPGVVVDVPCSGEPPPTVTSSFGSQRGLCSLF